MGTLKLNGRESFLEKPQVVETPTETAPFIIAIDTREQCPFLFQGLDKRVFTVTQTLKTGDYSILGLERRVCVERKSKQDLFGSVIHERKRFEREIQRMAKLERAAVFVECSMDEVKRGLDQSRIDPENVLLTAISWAGKYRVPWFFLHDRADAERAAFDFLRFAWRDFIGQTTSLNEENDNGRQDGTTGED